MMDATYCVLCTPAACIERHPSVNGAIVARQVALPVQQGKQRQQKHREVLHEVLRGCLTVNPRSRWTMQKVTAVLFAHIHGGG